MIPSHRQQAHHAAPPRHRGVQGAARTTPVAGPLRAWLGLILGTGCLLAIALAVVRSGTGVLSPPPAAPQEWSAWLLGREPLVAAMALMRLVVLALLAYLLAVTSVGFVARLLGLARLVRVVDLLTLPVIRRLLERAVGASVIAALAVTPVATPRALAQPPIPVMLDASSAPPGDVPARGEEPLAPNLGGAPIPLPVPDLHDLEASGEPGPSPMPEHGGEAGGHASPTEVGHHMVVAGESFWSIAADTLSLARGRPPSDGEVLAYWRGLIAANRDVLADRDNPDLIFPGQVFRVPPPDDEADRP